MTANQYRKIREGIGTQEEVAAMLGVHAQTISKRERGVEPISTEAALALEKLAERAPNRDRKNG